MNTSSSRSGNSLAMVIGIAVMLGTASYWLGFRLFDRTALLAGRAFIIAIGAILNLLFCWILDREFRRQPVWFRLFASFMGLGGSMIVFIGAALDLLHTIVQRDLILSFPFSQTQSIMVVGYAFLGIWLLLTNHHARIYDSWSHPAAWLGILTGIMMAAGLSALPRVFIPSASLHHDLGPEIGEWVGTLGWTIIYPIWRICFGSAGWNGEHGDLHPQRIK